MTVKVTQPSINLREKITELDSFKDQDNAYPFFAYQTSRQPIGLNTQTIFDIQAVLEDRYDAVDFSTNRFQPKIPGYYFLGFVTLMASASCRQRLYFYKNGSLYTQPYNSGSSDVSWAQGNTMVYMNGSSDYIEFYVSLSVAQDLYADTNFPLRGTHIYGYRVGK